MNTAISALKSVFSRPAAAQAEEVSLSIAEVSFADERELRTALVKAWRANPKQGAAAHAAYALIRGKSIDKTFTPLSSANKIASNAAGNPHYGRDAAIYTALNDYNGQAWGWASAIFEQAGLKRTRFAKQWDLSSNPFLLAWVEAAKASHPAWNR